jgi:hypothetical protein
MRTKRALGAGRLASSLGEDGHFLTKSERQKYGLALMPLAPRGLRKALAADAYSVVKGWAATTLPFCM